MQGQLGAMRRPASATAPAARPASARPLSSRSVVFTSPTAAMASGAARPASPGILSHRSVQSRATLHSDLAAVGTSIASVAPPFTARSMSSAAAASHIATAFEEPKLPPPPDRTPSRTIRLDTSVKRDRDQIFTRLHQLRAAHATAEGPLAEALSIAFYLQRELQRDDSELRATHRSLYEAESARADVQERLVEQEDLVKEYERLRFLPTNTDIDQLRRSVDQLERDVAAQARLAGEPVPRPPVPLPRGLSKPQQLQILVEMKFTALDNLVVVLRKRIAKLEEQSAATAAMQRGGMRSVEELLAELEALREENRRLRLREARYASDPLLRRRPPAELNAESQRALIIALQNELGFARSVIRAYNLEHNPSQRWLLLPAHVTNPREDERRDIDELLRRLQAGRDPIRRDEDEDPEPFAAPTSAWEQERRLRRFEEQAFDDKTRIEELQARVDQLQRALNDSIREREAERAAVGFGARPLDAKALHTKELQRLNEELLAGAARQDAVVQAVRQECAVLQEVVSDAQRARAEAEAQTLRLSQKLRGALHQILAQRSQIRALQQSLAAEREAALVMALSELDQHLPRPLRRKLLQAAYSDLVSTHSRLAWAAVVIQACVRGWLARRRAARMARGSARLRASVQRVRSWRAAERGAAPVGTGDLELISPRPGPRPVRMLAVLAELQRVLLYARGDAEALSSTQRAATLMRVALLDPLRAQVAMALRAADEDMRRMRAMADTVLRALAPSTHDDGVQTTPLLVNEAVQAEYARADASAQYEEQKPPPKKK